MGYPKAAKAQMVEHQSKQAAELESKFKQVGELIRGRDINAFNNRIIPFEDEIIRTEASLCMHISNSQTPLACNLNRWQKNWISPLLRELRAIQSEATIYYQKLNRAGSARYDFEACFAAYTRAKRDSSSLVNSPEMYHQELDKITSVYSQVESTDSFFKRIETNLHQFKETHAKHLGADATPSKAAADVKAEKPAVTDIAVLHMKIDDLSAQVDALTKLVKQLTKITKTSDMKEQAKHAVRFKFK